MGKNSCNKQNNRRRQLFQLLKVQSSFKKNLENNLPNLQRKYGNTKQITLKREIHIILKSVYNDGQWKYVIENMDIVDKPAKKRRNVVEMKLWR